jgi:hypothetical protein
MTNAACASVSATDKMSSWLWATRNPSILFVSIFLLAGISNQFKFVSSARLDKVHIRFTPNENQVCTPIYCAETFQFDRQVASKLPQLKDAINRSPRCAAHSA